MRQRVEEGQAVVEYVLMLFLALLLVATINGSLNQSIRSMWTLIVRDVSAPCPQCPTQNPIR
jgi:Flp pilus assembly pilin Flp